MFFHLELKLLSYTNFTTLFAVEQTKLVKEMKTTERNKKEKNTIPLENHWIISDTRPPFADHKFTMVTDGVCCICFGWFAVFIYLTPPTNKRNILNTEFTVHSDPCACIGSYLWMWHENTFDCSGVVPRADVCVCLCVCVCDMLGSLLMAVHSLALRSPVTVNKQR